MWVIFCFDTVNVSDLFDSSFGHIYEGKKNNLVFDLYINQYISYSKNWFFAYKYDVLFKFCRS